MRQRSFLYLLPVVLTILISTPAYTQTNIDSLWALLRTARPVADTTAAWKYTGKGKHKETCISGDCRNGYGISISNDGSAAGRYQYEGSFLNGKHHGIGMTRSANGFARVGNYEQGNEVGAYITQYNGLVKLQHVPVTSGKGAQKISRETGFALSVVQDHLAKSFEKLTPCNCLGRATHIAEEEYQQPYEVVDEKLKTNMGTRIRTATRTVEYPGLKNNCSNIIYIKAIANRGGYYFDNSMVVLPGQTIRKLPFNITYKNTREDIEYLGQYEVPK